MTCVKDVLAELVPVNGNYKGRHRSCGGGGGGGGGGDGCFLACEDLGRVFDDLFHVCGVFGFFFFKWNSACTH